MVLLWRVTPHMCYSRINGIYWWSSQAETREKSTWQRNHSALIFKHSSAKPCLPTLTLLISSSAETERTYFLSCVRMNVFEQVKMISWASRDKLLSKLVISLFLQQRISCNLTAVILLCSLNKIRSLFPVAGLWKCYQFLFMPMQNSC